MSEPSRLLPRLGRVRAAAWGALGAVALLCAGSGCLFKGSKAANPPATANANSPASQRYKVIADTTPFYKFGPQEPNGPDESLKKDAEVTMVSRAFGYSRVQAPDGQTGYVGTEDIAQLSADEIAAEDAVQQQADQAAAQTRLGPMAGGYTIPPGAGNDERLPLADPLPTAKPTPTPVFRY